MLENETNSVTFSCQAIGDPVPSVNWYFNDIMINVSDARKYNVSDLLNGIVLTSYLTITNAQSSDVGNYSCHAENFIGTDRSSGILTINGKYVHRVQLMFKFTHVAICVVLVCSV